MNTHQIIKESCVPVTGVTYYIYRLFCGKLIALDHKIVGAELVSSYVWT